MIGFILSALLLCSNVLSFNVNEYDVSSLHSLYNSTDGDNWLWRSNNHSGAVWNFDIDKTGNYLHDPCAESWQGVCCITAEASNRSWSCSDELNQTKAMKFFRGYEDVLEDMNPPQGISIFALSLPLYDLHGTLPVKFFNLTSLVFLELSYNRLYGSLPTSIASMQTLGCFLLKYNRLSFAIPEQIGLMTNLIFVDFTTNKFSKQMPSSLGMLQKLQTLYFIDNKLTGTIVPELGLMRALTTLYLTSNRIGGSIPFELFNATTLQVIDFAGNKLSKSIPEELGQLQSLFYFYVTVNRLTGTLPLSLVNCTSIKYIDFTKNLFSGTIPSSYGSLTGLISIFFSHNDLLHGTIPSSMGLLTNLNVLYFSDCQFTGSIPTSLCNLPALGSVYLSSNAFTSTMPSCIGDVQSLNILVINDNFFSGNLPASLGKLANITDVTLYGNKFTGPLPHEMSRMYSLENLLLHDNFLTGAPGSAFSDQQIHLGTVDLSDNNFSGDLPDSLFHLPNISNLALIKNCFSGSISDAICDASKLHSVAMDGLTSGSGCERPLLFKSYTTTRYMLGTIPSCLFNMPNIAVVQLAGNGLTGTLPATLSPSIRNVSLSYNRLNGIIPLSFQQRHFDKLDLSYNKLSGNIDAMSSFFLYNIDSPNDTHVIIRNFEKTQLILEVNRLSGLIPSTFYPSASIIPNIQLVTGNLFGCDFNSNLPSNDPGSRVNQCGSDVVNRALYVWVAFFGTVSLIALVLRVTAWNKTFFINAYLTIKDSLSANIRLMNQSESNSKALLSFAIHSQLPSTRAFLNTLNLLLIWTICCTATIMSIFLIVLLGLKYSGGSKYSTHQNQYAYAPSLAFLSGDVPAWLTMSFCCLLAVFLVWGKQCCCCCCLGLLTSREDGQDGVEADVIRNENDSAAMPYSDTILIFLLLPVCNLIIVAAANVGYLYVAINENYERTLCAQIALAIFKLVWNSRILPMMMRLHNQERANNTTSVTLFTALLVTNNIIVPLMTTLFSDSNCFYNVVVSPNTVDALFIYEVDCLFVYKDDCLGKLLKSVDFSYNPPFIYGYQCSSAVLAHYVPVFVLMYIYLGFIAVIQSLAVTWLHERMHRDLPETDTAVLGPGPGQGSKQYSEQQSSSSSSSAPATTQLSSTCGNVKIVCLALLGCDVMKSSKQWEQSLTLVNNNNNSHLSIDVTTHSSSFDSPLMRGYVISASLVCNFATLLTFGIAYPLLAALICFAMCVETLQWRVLVGRYLLWCEGLEDGDQRLKSVAVERLERSCAGVGQLISTAVWIVISVMCGFIAFFLFDITGGNAKDDTRKMLWAPVTLLMLPMLLWTIKRVTICACGKSRHRDGEGDYDASDLPGRVDSTAHKHFPTSTLVDYNKF